MINDLKRKSRCFQEEQDSSGNRDHLEWIPKKCPIGLRPRKKTHSSLGSSESAYATGYHLENHGHAA